MPILGLGHDVVDVAAFAEQLAEPGSRMRNLFSARELRQAAMRAQAKHDDEAVHLAVRWAGKEAVLKAWCEALADRPSPYTLDDFPWAGIEILDDSRGRPSVVLRADVAARLVESLQPAGEPAMPSAGEPAVPPAATPTMTTPATTHAVVSAVSSSARLWHISLSHDGPVASAVAILDGE